MARRLIHLTRLWLRTLPQGLGLCASLLGAVASSGVRLAATLAYSRLRHDRMRPDVRELLRTWRGLAADAIRESVEIVTSRLLIGFTIAVWAVYAWSGLCLCRLLPDASGGGALDLAGAPHVFQSLESLLDASPSGGRRRDVTFH